MEEHQSHPEDLAPPFYGICDTLLDALILFEAAKRGIIPRIRRRLYEAERAALIKSGAIFIFDSLETPITRWTDGKTWSASRMKDNYLLYRETEKKRTIEDADHARRKALKGEEAQKMGDEVKRWVCSIQHDSAYRDKELVKRTITVDLGESKQHMVSYYSLADALKGELRRPSEVPELAVLAISREYLEPKKAFRVPPNLGTTSTGQLVYMSEGDTVGGKLDSPTSTHIASPEVEYHPAAGPSSYHPQFSPLQNHHVKLYPGGLPAPATERLWQAQPPQATRSTFHHPHHHQLQHEYYPLPAIVGNGSHDMMFHPQQHGYLHHHHFSQQPHQQPPVGSEAYDTFHQAQQMYFPDYQHPQPLLDSAANHIDGGPGSLCVVNGNGNGGEKDEFEEEEDDSSADRKAGGFKEDEEEEEEEDEDEKDPWEEEDPEWKAPSSRR